MLTSLVLVCFVGTFCAYSTYCTGVEYCLFVHRSFHNLLLDKRTSPHFLFILTRRRRWGGDEQLSPMKRLLALLIVLLIFASCEEYYLFLESIKQEDKYKLIYNIPNSNWDSIILMSDDDAFCMNVDDSLQKELLAIINNNTDFRIKFDELTRPTIFAVDNLSIDIVYTTESIQFIYEIDGVSNIETYPLPDLIQTRSSVEDVLVFTGEVVKSQVVDYVIDVIDGILESALGTPILGAFDDFVDMVDTLRDLDNLSDAVELVDYLESEIDIIKFIDLIKKRPTYEEDDSTTYIVGLTAGHAQVIDNRAKLELLVTIIGKSKGGNLDFEYGVCYSKINSIPMYTDATVGTRFIGMTGQTYIEITDPHTFETVELEGGKFYYRGYFKDNDTGNVIYSDNVKSFTIESESLTLNSISYKNDYYYYESDGVNYVAYDCTANISGNTMAIENLYSCGIYLHDYSTGGNYKWGDEYLYGNYDNEDIDLFIGVNISNFDKLNYENYLAEATKYGFGVYIEYNDGTYYLSEPKACKFVYDRKPSYKYLSVGAMSVSVTDSYEDDNGETVLRYRAEHPVSYAIDGVKIK